MTGWLTVEVGERRVEAVVAGAADGVPLVFHHGTPAAATELPQLLDPALACGLRVVFPSRPGYGGSTPRPGRSVADVVEDVVAVLDGLGVERFVTLGWSGGGPHALACAALLPDRCSAAATLAGVAPREAAGWTGRAGWPTRTSRSSAPPRPPRKPSRRTSRAWPPTSATSRGRARGRARRAGARGRPRGPGGWSWPTRWPSRSGGRVAHGVAGWRDDDLAFVRPWGFDLTRSRSPSRSGRAAATAWCRRARAVARGARPDARAHFEPGEGHLSLVPQLARILVDLRQLAGA